MRHDNAHGVRGGLLEDSKDGAYNSLVMISLCLVWWNLQVDEIPKA